MEENDRLAHALEALILSIDAGGATLGAMSDARAALASHAAPPAAQEPKGYRVRVKSDDPEEWQYMSTARALDFIERDGIEAQPLYTAPQPACQQEAVAESDLAAARAEIERLTKGRDLSKELLRSCIQGNNVLRKKAQKAIAERDEARSMLADAERDMRQRAAEICRSVAPPKTYHRGDHTGSMQVIAQKCAAAILALPLKHADREGG